MFGNVAILDIALLHSFSAIYSALNLLQLYNMEEGRVGVCCHSH